MGHKEQLELSALIAEKWMKWHKEYHPGMPEGDEEEYGTFVWLDAEHNFMADAGWSPGANPADCATVKAKARENGSPYSIFWNEREQIHEINLYDHEEMPNPPDQGRSHLSEEEAFCLAVKAAIGATQ